MIFTINYKNKKQKIRRRVCNIFSKNLQMISGECVFFRCENIMLFKRKKTQHVGVITIMFLTVNGYAETNHVKSKT